MTEAGSLVLKVLTNWKDKRNSNWMRDKIQ